MYPKSLIAASLMSAALVSTQATCTMSDAEVITDNPIGLVYVASLPNSDTTTLRGSITATAKEGGKGVGFEVDFTGIPEEGGPFSYHIHDQPVPKDGNCTSTLAHHDPYVRGEDPKCDPKEPQTCQVGDLSGKYGGIESGEEDYSTSYVDLYASTKGGIGSFIGNRSIVVHMSDKSRIACANFMLVDDEPTPSGTVSGTNSGRVPSATPTGDVPPFDDAATRDFVSAGAVLAAVAALVW